MSGARLHGVVAAGSSNGRDIIGPRLHCGGSAAAPGHPENPSFDRASRPL